jgi:hypothetical protein
LLLPKTAPAPTPAAQPAAAVFQRLTLKKMEIDFF